MNDARTTSRPPEAGEAREKSPAPPEEEGLVSTGEKVAGRLGALVLGIVLIVVGIALGVSVVLLPVGIAVGVVGIGFVLMALCAPAFGGRK
jgi:hypothetical protein